MNIDNGKHVALFAIVAGFLLYLALAFLQAVFIVAVPQAPDWATDVVEVETGNGEVTHRPVAFKNTLEELKYHHNVRMAGRNKYFLGGIVLAGVAASVFVFYTIPKWRGHGPSHDDHARAIVGQVALGAMVALIVPLVIGWILPPPATWFPQEICDIADMR